MKRPSFFRKSRIEKMVEMKSLSSDGPPRILSEVEKALRELEERFREEMEELQHLQFCNIIFEMKRETVFNPSDLEELCRVEIKEREGILISQNLRRVKVRKEEMRSIRGEGGEVSQISEISLKFLIFGLLASPKDSVGY